VGLACGDFSGDGVADIIVTGAVNGSNTLALANTKGRVTVIAGGTSQIFGDSAAGTLDALPKMVGASSDSYMGARLCVGDFGSDTVNDVLVTLPAADNGNHQVMLVNGVNPLPATLTPAVTFDYLDTSTPDAFLPEARDLSLTCVQNWPPRPPQIRCNRPVNHIFNLRRD
jgi:hypothetical protein